MKQSWKVFVIGTMIAASNPGSSTAQWVEVPGPEERRIKDLLVEGPYLFAATGRSLYLEPDGSWEWSGIAPSGSLGRRICWHIWSIG